MIVKACLLLLIGACLRAHGFYLPGVAPQDYGKGAAVVLKVNKLSSTKTQLPYEFYSLPYCRPATIKSSAENLGEVLRGDRIENSLYEIKMRTDEYCKFLCRMDSLMAAQAKAFQAKVDDQYRVNMILDNLPVAMVKTREDSANRQYTTYERGFPVGFKGAAEEGVEQAVYLNNHLRFTVLYHSDKDSEVSRVVGFEVEPFSVKHRYDGEWNEASTVLTSCNGAAMVSVSHDMEPQVVKESEEIIFTYDVIFKWSAIKWASRWDTYLMMQDDQIHWFSIVNSLMIVLFLSGMVAMIMLRTLHRDIAQYNQLESAEEVQEETGWKLVHGDVFRPPAQSSLLATLVGTGVQLLGMTLVTILFAMLGFLSPSNRGGLITAMLLLFVLMGFAGGFVAGRLYRQLRGTDWRSMTLRTALLFPGLAFTVFFLLNLLIWGQASSGAVPFLTLTSLCFLWFGISVPLVCVGSLIGFRQPPLDDPVHTNKIPRQVTPQPWYMNPVFSCLLGSVLPFGAVFIELFFILTSIWLHQFYYIFGFLFLVAIILLITCAEISVVLAYFQLCSEDYRWWWRSFFTSGTSALYLLLYSAFYFCTKLDITATIPMLMYFSYMAVIAIGFFCLTGTIGFVASFLFIRTIYAAVKID